MSTLLDAYPMDTAIIEGLSVNLTKQLTVQDYITKYRRVVFGPVFALNKDSSYLQTGIAIQHFSDNARDIVLVDHAPGEKRPGTIQAMQRGKIVYNGEFTRGMTDFFEDPAVNTLIQVTRVQDMNAQKLKRVSPSGLFLQQWRNLHIVIVEGEFPGDACLKPFGAKKNMAFTTGFNDTDYVHIIEAYQSSISYPHRKQREYMQADTNNGPQAPDSGGRRLFRICVQPHKPFSIKLPPKEYGVYCTTTPEELYGNDSVDGNSADAQFYADLRSELVSKAEVNLIAYNVARKGQVVNICAGRPATQGEVVHVEDANNCSFKDYNMIDNEA